MCRKENLTVASYREPQTGLLFDLDDLAMSLWNLAGQGLQDEPSAYDTADGEGVQVQVARVVDEIVQGQRTSRVEAVVRTGGGDEIELTLIRDRRGRQVIAFPDASWQSTWAAIDAEASAHG